MAATPSTKEQAEIDAVLDAALDELDEDDEEDDEEEEEDKEENNKDTVKQEETIATTTVRSSEDGTTEDTARAAAAPVVMGPPRPPEATSSAAATESLQQESEQLHAMMQQMLRASEQGSGPPAEFVSNMLQEMQSEFNSEIENSKKESQASRDHSSSSPSPSPPLSSIPPPNKQNEKNGKKAKAKRRKAPASASVDGEVDVAIATLLEDLAMQSADEGGDGKDLPPEDLLNSLGELMDSVDGLGEDFNPDSVIDGMMEQLLSKELMYDPMKQVAERFPKWLQEKRSSLPPEEYSSRSSQCECFQKLVHVYETEPGNTKRLVLLMQQVQEYGQPPRDIIEEIAPGLELDDDGMPKFDPNSEECRIM